MQLQAPPDSGVQEIIATAILGGWAFLGSIMRGATDWINPKTGKFSWGLFSASIATALVLGEGAGAWGTAHHWEPFATNALAGGLGYLGPAAALTLIKSRLGVSADSRAKDKNDIDASKP